MRRLDNLLEKVQYELLAGTTGKEVSDIVFDSRIVTPGSLFVAVRGTQSDGHDYIVSAVEKGAIAIICEEINIDTVPGITFLKVPDSSKALGIVASEFYGNPSAKMKLVGVTGTNGKTTIATLLFKLFSGLGYKCGLISTVENIIVNTSIQATHTTPDPVRLNKTLAAMVDECCDYAFMEVSSHALHQNRVSGLEFAGAIFSNITHDHLDYHKTFDKYIEAKKSFFDGLQSTSWALINSDDKNGEVMVQNCKARKQSYSIRGMATYRGVITENAITGLSLRIGGNDFWSRLIGEFNASNLMAVYGSAMLLGADKEEVLRVLSGLNAVAGRFEVIRSENGITGIVDYAHTPDAIENVLTTIRDTKSKGSQVIVVVGAGGDRDRSKRPLMAKSAARLSDKLILTSDNPRSEEPGDIIEEMRKGLEEGSERKTLSITDRKQAIQTAVMLALPGDIILVAGKGHETYQEIKGVKHHFDDREVLSSIFNNMKGK